MADLIDTIVYAGRLKNKVALMSSSSGGVFIALSDFFLENGNAVAAAIYNYDNHTTEFQMILDKYSPDEVLVVNYIFTTVFSDYCNLLKNLYN